MEFAVANPVLKTEDLLPYANEVSGSETVGCSFITEGNIYWIFVCQAV